MQRYCLWIFAALLLTLPGCMTPEMRLYGKWRAQGLLGLAIQEVNFNPDGTAVVQFPASQVVYDWEIQTAEGDKMQVLWTNKTDSTQVAVTGSLEFTDPDTIAVEIPGTPAIVKLVRDKPAE